MGKWCFQKPRLDFRDKMRYSISRFFLHAYPDLRGSRKIYSFLKGGDRSCPDPGGESCGKQKVEFLLFLYNNRKRLLPVCLHSAREKGAKEFLQACSKAEYLHPRKRYLREGNRAQRSPPLPFPKRKYLKDLLLQGNRC